MVVTTSLKPSGGKLIHPHTNTTAVHTDGHALTTKCCVNAERSSNTSSFVDKFIMGVWNQVLKQSQDSIPQVKTVVLIGGSAQTQKKYISKLYPHNDTFGSSPTEKVVNDIYLGYTYIQYRDTSKRLLSTLNIYTVLEGDVTCQSLLKRILRNVSSTDLVFIPLFDYSESPANWLRNLCTWLSFFDGIYRDQANVLILVINRGSNIDLDQMVHEFIQQSLRTVALEHGCSLLYTVDESNDLLEIIASILNMKYKVPFRSLLKPFTVDYQRFFIPKGCDTSIKLSALCHEGSSDSLTGQNSVNNWILGDMDNEYISKYEKMVKP